MTEFEKLKAEIKAELKAEVMAEIRKAEPERVITPSREFSQELNKLLSELNEEAGEEYKIKIAIQTVARLALGYRMLSNMLRQDVPVAIEISKEVLAIISKHRVERKGKNYA